MLSYKIMAKYTIVTRIIRSEVLIFAKPPGRVKKIYIVERCQTAKTPQALLIITSVPREI